MRIAPLVTLLIVAWMTSCAPSSLPATSAHGTGEVASSSTEPPAGTAPEACEPLPSHPTVARAAWSEQQVLMVVGKQKDRGESDRPFEVLEGHLLLTSGQGRCLLARVALGELTRTLPDSAPSSEAPAGLELEALPLGQVEAFDDPVAFERFTLAGGLTVALVHLMRDVRWGLTERYVVPVTVRGKELIAGSRVQEGRDSMGPPVFYGAFKLADVTGDGAPDLVMTREGMGRFSKRVVFTVDPTGALRATEEPVEPAAAPVPAAQRDGRDVAHALEVCGPKGARQTLSSQPCPDGSGPQVKRAGSVGMADDAHMVDRYEVTCGSETKKLHVDIYHCNR